MPKVIEEAQILSHDAPIAGVDILTLAAPQIAQLSLPGQFVQVSVPVSGGFLRRPLGIAEVSRTDGWIRLIYRQVGRGTEALAGAAAGAYVSVLGPLGRGFDTALSHPLLVGGGMGLTPLLFFAAAHPNVSVLMGGAQRKKCSGRKFTAPMCANASSRRTMVRTARRAS